MTPANSVADRARLRSHRKSRADRGLNDICGITLRSSMRQAYVAGDPELVGNSENDRCRRKVAVLFRP